MGAIMALGGRVMQGFCERFECSGCTHNMSIDTLAIDTKHTPSTLHQSEPTGLQNVLLHAVIP